MSDFKYPVMVVSLHKTREDANNHTGLALCLDLDEDDEAIAENPRFFITELFRSALRELNEDWRLDIIERSPQYVEGKIPSGQAIKGFLL